MHGSSGAGTVVRTIPALDAGELRIPLQLQATAATATIALVVAVVGWAVQVFAGVVPARRRPLRHLRGHRLAVHRGMLLVVQSADLVLTLVGWEVMGWCSYLLIGHWSRKESARRAALKAFLVTRLADVGFVLGVVILAAGAGSTAYPQVLQAWAGHGLPRRRRLRRPRTRRCSPPPWCCSSSASSASPAWCRSTTGCPTRWRARPPPPPSSTPRRWSPPGTFVLAQLFDLLAAADGARWLLAVSTAVTMVYAAVLAFGQSDLKRLLAYSTLSQVALMLSALAVAPADEGPGAGVLHLYSHAFFKALLFLAIGWLSVTVGGTAAATMRGGLRGHLFIRPGDVRRAARRWRACRRWSGSSPRSTSSPRPRPAPPTARRAPGSSCWPGC